MLDFISHHAINSSLTDKWFYEQMSVWVKSYDILMNDAKVVTLLWNASY